jgi:hypothetical protein
MSDDPDFDDIPEGDPDADALAEAEAAQAKNSDAYKKGMAWLNRNYAFIEARPDSVLDLEWIGGDGQRTRTLSIKQFHNVLAPYRLEIKTKRGWETKPLSALWFASRQRRQFIDADYFGPNETVPRGHLNLYHGPATMPVKGSWLKLEWFLRNIVCGGDDPVYDYVLKLIQWKIQNPTKNPEVGLLLMGPRGVGKGTFAKFLRLIFGPDHFLQFNDSDQAQNKYNTIIQGRFVLFYDETIYGHDPKIKQKIKGQITEPMQIIEPKFVSPYPMKNIALRVFASDQVAAVPIDADDRRLVVLGLSTLKQEDHVYFRKLRAAMDGGEVAAFIHDALAADLTAFEKVRRMPVATKAKAILAQTTGNEVAAFLFRLLRRGYLPGVQLKEDRSPVQDRTWFKEAVLINRSEVYYQYIDYMIREHSARKPVSQFQFWQEIGRIITGKDEMKGVNHWSGGSQMWLRRFPSREVARAYWEKYEKRKVEWPAEAVKPESAEPTQTRGGAPPPMEKDYGF